MMEAIDSVQVPHMPKSGARFLRHANSVAGVAMGCNRPHRRRRPELALQVGGCFEPAAGEHDCAARRERFRAASHARDLVVLVPKPLDRRRVAHGDAAPGDMFVRDLE
jgi:hypothetical protein